MSKNQDRLAWFVLGVVVGMAFLAFQIATHPWLQRIGA